MRVACSYGSKDSVVLFLSAVGDGRAKLISGTSFCRADRKIGPASVARPIKWSRALGEEKGKSFDSLLLLLFLRHCLLASRKGENKQLSNNQWISEMWLWEHNTSIQLWQPRRRLSSSANTNRIDQSKSQTNVFESIGNPLAHSPHFFFLAAIQSLSLLVVSLLDFHIYIYIFHGWKAISKSNGGKTKKENPTPVRWNQNTSLYSFRCNGDDDQGNLIWTNLATTTTKKSKSERITCRRSFLSPFDNNKKKSPKEKTCT